MLLMHLFITLDARGLVGITAMIDKVMMVDMARRDIHVSRVNLVRCWLMMKGD